jgi:two-component system sensor histidine kinase TctE
VSKAGVPLSLRRHLLLRLLPGVLTLIIVGAIFSYFMALKFANLAYDRWLLDSAKSLATQVKLLQGQATFHLPREAFEIFEWDEIDKTYYSVSSASTGLLAGYRDLPAPERENTAKEPTFFDAQYRGAAVRGVRIHAATGLETDAVSITVVETTRKRRTLAEDVLTVVLLPQVVLIMLVGWQVSAGVRSGLQSLVDVTQDLEAKGHRDLSPLAVERVPVELKPIVDRMNELLVRLGRAMESQREFVAEAAHQLRTPLAGLKLQSENLLRAQVPDDVRESVLLMKATADRAVHLSNQLLTLARAEPEFNPLRDFVSVDLVSMARDAGAHWIPQALASGVDIELDAPEHAVMIQGNITLLGELVSNLVDNAVRYGAKPGKVKVTVCGDPVPSITVEDDGPGLTPDLARRVFDRFYRTPDATSTGSGLGLAIVKEIAELHGGTASIESLPALNGTRVRVAFPAAGRA